MLCLQANMLNMVLKMEFSIGITLLAFHTLSIILVKLTKTVNEWNKRTIL